MRLLTNPIFLKMTALLFASAFALMSAAFLIRRVRQSFVDEDSVPAVCGTADQLPLYAVVQQLKQQKQEITALREAERKRSQQAEATAIALRHSLDTICRFARQLAQNHDPELAKQLAAEIVTEAQQMNHRCGSLSEGKATPILSTTRS